MSVPTSIDVTYAYINTHSYIYVWSHVNANILTGLAKVRTAIRVLVRSCTWLYGSSCVICVGAHIDTYMSIHMCKCTLACL